jgi:hypothetical protein
MSEYREELEKLFTLGKPEGGNQQESWENYVREFSLNSDDIPSLIQIVLDNSHEEFEEPKSWAAIHAWRALAQLKAKEAIPTFIEVLERDVWEDWGWEDLPLILGQFGIDALEPVYQFALKHRGNFEIGLMTISTLEEIAKTDDKLIEPIKSMMMELLSEADKNDEGVNGTIIGFLKDVKAYEALPLIEKAFAGDYVDTFVAGDWDDAQVAFGLKDPSELKPKPSIWDFLESASSRLDSHVESEKLVQKKKAKRNMAKKSKQINRQKKKKK